MIPDLCEQCGGPVSEAAKFCLKCGNRAGRPPATSFKLLTLIFFALIGAGYAVYAARKPKFKAAFQPLGTPGVTHS